MPNMTSKIIVTVVLILLVVIAFFTYQNYRSQRTQQQAQLMYKMQDDFFFKDERLPKILRLIEDDKPILKANGGEYTDYDLDDYLGFMELLDDYVDDGVLPYDWVYDQFGYYITQAYKNSEVRDYLLRTRQQSDFPETIFAGFVEIANRIAKEDSTELAKRKLQK